VEVMEGGVKLSVVCQLRWDGALMWFPVQSSFKGSACTLAYEGVKNEPLE
jgi:hypothetical protein